MTARAIEVLEGLEPVRRRPGMYVGGTDERALHHLAAEVLDNAMDEAVAGHANRIEVTLEEGNRLTITDNGRGIPVDEHPKFPGKSALEVILTTLHSGGKFSGKAYATSGGLHGVGVSVVNALSSHTRVEVARGKELYAQEFSQGPAHRPAEVARRHTQPARHYGQLHPRSRNLRRGREVQARPPVQARPLQGLSVRRGRNPLEMRGQPGQRGRSRPKPCSSSPAASPIISPNSSARANASPPSSSPGSQDFPKGEQIEEQGRVEWAVAWPLWSDGAYSWYCNTIPTPDGGTHEAGLRAALVKGVRAFADLVGLKKAKDIAPEDVVTGSELMLSVFVRDPQFQSQTKDRLTRPEAARLVENAVRDHFDHFLADNMERGKALLGYVVERMEERLARKAEREVKRKTATNARKLRLPGKLTDCTGEGKGETELFIVEGDSAGGSAKQARDRKTQAILPIRGKILNVASATADKIRANSEIADLGLALGCGFRKDCNPDNLRYDRVIIMTDADVDGAHIATLLMTFFFQEMPELVRRGHLYLAQPPLYRLTSGKESAYARDDAHRAELEAAQFKGKKVEVGRFKGLGEMNPQQLRETTMDPKTRGLLRITLPPEFEGRAAVKDLVDRLMGRNPEHRFMFIQNRAGDLDPEMIDA